MIVFVALAVCSLLALLAFLWIAIPAFYGPPSVPTRENRIRKALQLAGLQPDENLYDLGAGDGRVLFIAAREFNANAVGIEIGPVQCALINLRAVSLGLGRRVKVKWANYFTADLKEADVVFIYATSKEILKLAAHLPNAMKPGTRLVSISADFPEWEPTLFDQQDLLFVYTMPPNPGSLTTYLLKQA